LTRSFVLCVLLVLVAASSSAEEETGRVAYERVCGDCHGSKGQGDIALGIVPLGYDADYVFVIVREGYVEMPPISKREISDEEVRRVVAYLEWLSKEPAEPGSESPPPDGRLQSKPKV
jgi:mono/diheme cytochrome c family protein